MSDDTGNNSDSSGSGASTGNNNNGSSGSGSIENRMFRMQVESSLSQRFVKAMEIRMKQLEVTQAQDFKLSKPESAVLMNIVKANVIEGTVAGIVTFFLLRRFHVEYFKLLQRRLRNDATNHQGSTATNTMKSPTSSTPNAFNSPYQQVHSMPKTIDAAASSTGSTGSFSNGPSSSSSSSDSGNASFGSARWIVNATSFLFDGIVSLYVAVAVSSRNPDKFVQELGELPLMEGTSAVSRELCPILLQELQRIHFDLAHDNANSHPHLPATLPKISPNNKIIVRDAIANPQTPVLRCFLNFCTNCQRRSAYEQVIREQSGIANDTEISIPPPGVPASFDVTNDMSSSLIGSDPQLRPEESMYDDSNFDNDINNNTGISTDWTEPFVTDQEDDHRRRK